MARLLPWLLALLCAGAVAALPPPPPLEPALEREAPWSAWDPDERPEPRPLYPWREEHPRLGATDWQIGEQSHLHVTFGLPSGAAAFLQIPLTGRVHADDADLRLAEAELVAQVEQASTANAALATALQHALGSVSLRAIRIQVHDVSVPAAPRRARAAARGQARVTAEVGDQSLEGEVNLLVRRLEDGVLEVTFGGTEELGLDEGGLKRLGDEIWEHSGVPLGDQGGISLYLSLSR